MRSASAGALLFSLALSLGCSDPEPRGERAPGGRFARSLDSRDEQVLRFYRGRDASARTDLCGAKSTSGEARAILVVSGRQCLSCSNVGFAARRLQEMLPAAPEPLAILTSRADTSMVCAFVKGERLRIPVVAVPDSLFQTSGAGDLLTLALFDPKAKSFKIYHAKDGLELLSLAPLDSIREAATPPHSP